MGAERRSGSKSSHTKLSRPHRSGTPKRSGHSRTGASPSSPACRKRARSEGAAPSSGPPKRARAEKQDKHKVTLLERMQEMVSRSPSATTCPCGGQWRTVTAADGERACQWRSPACRERHPGAAILRVCSGGQPWCQGAACVTCIRHAAERKVLHIVYSPNTETRSGEVEAAHFGARPGDAFTAQCCQMTQDIFWRKLLKSAEELGFSVHKRRVETLEQWAQLGKDARAGKLSTGPVAVFHHSTMNDKIEKETIPFWEFYPVLQEVSKRGLLLYPGAPQVDQRHSEKSYTSKLMPPTEVLLLKVNPESNQWQLPSLQEVTAHVQRVRSRAQQKKIDDSFIMLKLGCTWGGRDVYRSQSTPEAVYKILTEQMMPRAPTKLQQVYVLFQLFIPVVAELRFCLLDGEIVQHGWEGLIEPPVGGRAREDNDETWDFWVDEAQSRQKLKDSGLDDGAGGLEKLVESTREKMLPVVLDEMRADFGELPQWVRVDFLVTAKHGLFLGERESFGADLLGDENGKPQQKLQKRIAQHMAARAAHFYGLPVAMRTPTASPAAPPAQPPRAPTPGPAPRSGSGGQ
eukprot:TRINITY_DN1594_c0_g1_i1.p1 TRINITY_DN1594_c0_g1~~TRINITY_DN1594_c0_g1_i1.p1  ORF type:complete len:608 (+),score=209.30 TRINITY_DN1594_c0_g1_i1:104-1825(+)